VETVPAFGKPLGFFSAGSISKAARTAALSIDRFDADWRLPARLRRIYSENPLMCKSSEYYFARPPLESKTTRGTQ
jgi:hypothetical protein